MSDWKGLRLAPDAQPWHPSRVFHVGDVILKLREGRDWTLADLHDRSGVSVTAISNIEDGKGNPKRATLQKLADALGVTLADLETGVPPSGDHTRQPSVLQGGHHDGSPHASFPDPHRRPVDLAERLSEAERQLRVLTRTVEQLRREMAKTGTGTTGRSRGHRKPRR